MVASRPSRWTTLTSFGVQAVVIAVLLIVPLLTKVALPSARTVSTPVSFIQHDLGPVPGFHEGRTSGIQIIPYTGRISLPGRLPRPISVGDDSGPPPSETFAGGGIYSGPIGSGPGFAIPTGGDRLMPAPPPAAPSTRAFRSSRMLEGSLIRRIQPSYPPLARSARIQGPVVLAAVISKAGTMQNLRVVSGHPMLVQAALDAVSQWRYRPYILNGDAIEVETQITVNFVLGSN